MPKTRSSSIRVCDNHSGTDITSFAIEAFQGSAPPKCRCQQGLDPYKRSLNPPSSHRIKKGPFFSTLLTDVAPAGRVRVWEVTL